MHSINKLDLQCLCKCLLLIYDDDPQGEESPALRRCYEGVQRDGEVIRVRDTVLLRSGPRKKSLPYVAKVSAFWEDPESGTPRLLSHYLYLYLSICLQTPCCFSLLDCLYILAFRLHIVLYSFHCLPCFG